MAEPLLPFIETHISFPNNFAHVRACTYTYFFFRKPMDSHPLHREDTLKEQSLDRKPSSCENDVYRGVLSGVQA